MTRAVASRGARSAGSAAPRSSGGGRPRSSAGPVLRYFQRAELPLTSLVFLLPLIVLYEIGTHLVVAPSPRGTEQRIVAFNLLQQFFALFGASGRYMPALAVTVILLAWHLARKDSWQVDLTTVMGMGFESFVLAVPLIIMGFAAARYLAMLAARGPGEHTQAMLVLSVGAGIYEELVFRLAAFTLLNLLLLDVLGMRRFWAHLLIVAVSSLLFASYHYLGDEPFQWRTFAFRTLAGAYFGLIFALRGFGITAGTHAAYDLLIVSLRALASP
jgi:hypothetical protein